MEIFPIFITIVGFIIGLGAVIVIDLHGFLGRTSGYWTEATIRAHKVTKPLIWIGIALVIVGALMMKNAYILSLAEYSIWMNIIVILIANGLFLSFVISPKLIHREKMGLSGEILPKKMQHQVMGSFILSFIGWWSLVFLFINVIK
ncbi:MAG: hypothetical protein RL687_538 [Candidatus Parcubacteria bacterium]